VELHRDLQEINSKLTSSTKTQADALIESEKRLIVAIENIGASVKKESDMSEEKRFMLEKRVISLEKWRWGIAGGGVTIGYLLTQIAPLITKLLSN
jgi:hypothetical protein